jgi:hypothetical protein
VFAFILVGDSFMEFPIAYEALLRWVVALIIGVKALEKVVAAVKELVQSPRVVEPGEVSTSPTTVVLRGVNA